MSINYLSLFSLIFIYLFIYEIECKNRRPSAIGLVRPLLYYRRQNKGLSDEEGACASGLWKIEDCFSRERERQCSLRSHGHQPIDESSDSSLLQFDHEGGPLVGIVYFDKQLFGSLIMLWGGGDFYWNPTQQPNSIFFKSKNYLAN